MRRLFLLTGLGGAISCASSGSPGSTLPSPTDRVVVADNEAVLRTTVPPNAKATIPADPARVFEAGKVVYEELGVPVTIADPSISQVGNPNFFRTRKLGNERISLYLSCGNSVTGVIADDYRIYMSVVSAVRPDGKGGSVLETAFTAYARNIDGSASERIVCGSTGQLEERIRLGISRKVAGS